MKMHLPPLVALLTLVGAASANQRHARLARKYNYARDTTTPSMAAGTSTSSPVTSSSSAAVPGATTSAATTAAPTIGPQTNTWGTTIPPLTQITSGMPSQPTLPLTATYPAGAKPPISGAPVLPTPFVFQVASWPPQDQIAPTDSAEVSEWMQELNGFDIPDIPPTADGTCAGDPAAAADAAERGWWTCGGYTRDTDITACPDQLTWGVSFDDGPAFYSKQLLDYLSSINVTSTFFVVGSRVVERPQVLIEEYMTGHEIAVHTWSHRPLTMLTTEQVVAELGWTRKAIKDVIGVTPTLMRPPYGDIDDRVRAISLAMGMVPVIWTRTPSGATFDTNDWKVAGGVVNGSQSFATFQAILNNATLLDTGFIVLEHDLYPQTVDLAIGYTLPAALNFTPHLTMDSIGHCNDIPATNLYRESNQNTSFPYPNSTSGDSSVPSGSGGSTSTSKSKTGGSVSMLNRDAIPMTVIGTVVMAAFSALLL
ncbi:carbohydrate esterase family 4 protein [Pisolithus sp. B1]|nr:carbohydrate esterase family 4 protein [Pisolithus sp. B1]